MCFRKPRPTKDQTPIGRVEPIFNRASRKLHLVRCHTRHGTTTNKAAKTAEPGLFNDSSP